MILPCTHQRRPYPRPLNAPPKRADRRLQGIYSDTGTDKCCGNLLWAGLSHLGIAAVAPPPTQVHWSLQGLKHERRLYSNPESRLAAQTPHQRLSSKQARQGTEREKKLLWKKSLDDRWWICKTFVSSNARCPSLSHQQPLTYHGEASETTVLSCHWRGTTLGFRQHTSIVAAWLPIECPSTYTFCSERVPSAAAAT